MSITNVYIDIETLPDIWEHSTQRWDRALAATPKRITRPEERAKWASANLAKVWADGALDPMRGRVMLVCFAVENGEVEILDAIVPRGTEFVDNERGALSALRNRLAQHQPYRLIGHNVAGFDVPFLQLRAMKLGVSGLAAMVRNAKPWDTEPVCDTMLHWPTTTHRGQPTGTRRLAAIEAFLGFPSRSGPTDAKELLALFMSGQMDRIRQRCIEDVQSARLLHQRLREEGLIP